MKQLTIDDLRALIRLIPAARALQEELDKSIHLETFEGTSDLAVRSFTGLQRSIMSITEDPYVMALGINVVEGMPEKQLIAQVILASSQLIAYLEGQAGVAGLTGRQNYTVQTAPTITLNMDGFQGGPQDTARIMDTLDRAIRFRPPQPPAPPHGAPPPHPPVPPHPPMPPQPGRPFGHRDSFDEPDEGGDV